MLRGGRPAAAAVLGGRAGCMFILVQRKHFFEVERGLGQTTSPSRPAFVTDPANCTVGVILCVKDFIATPPLRHRQTTRI